MATTSLAQLVEPERKKRRSPWEGISDEERRRRVAKMQATWRKKHAPRKPTKHKARALPVVQAMELPLVQAIAQVPHDASNIDTLAALIVAVWRKLESAT